MSWLDVPAALLLLGACAVWSVWTTAYRAGHRRGVRAARRGFRW